MSRYLAAFIAGLMVMALLWGAWQIGDVSAGDMPPDAPQAAAQAGGSSTAPPVELPTGTATNTPLPSTATRTPTSEGPAFVEARNPDANVRSGPGTDFDRLGQIQPGEQYFIIGQRFEWYQIEYPNSPTRTAWVFNGVVDVFGDVDRITDLAQQDVPTIDPAIAANAETQLAATQTPGGLLTLTAQAQVTPQGIFTTTAQPSTTLAPGEKLPTFTFPPFTNTPIPVEELQSPITQVNAAGEEPFAPAVPVLGLLGLGTLGLLVSLFRQI